MTLDEALEQLERDNLPVIEIKNGLGETVAVLVRTRGQSYSRTPAYTPRMTPLSEYFARNPAHANRMRPGQKLSKRQRDNAKRERLRPLTRSSSPS